MAPVRRRDGDGDRLAFPAGEVRGTEHDRSVECEVRLQGVRIQAMGRQDVVGPLGAGGGLDPGHRKLPNQAPKEFSLQSAGGPLQRILGGQLLNAEPIGRVGMNDAR